MIVMTAISRFKSDGNESVLKKALLYALDLEDHVRYDRAGEYSFIIYPVLEFFQENDNYRKLVVLLKEILSLLENSACLLQDEGSWLEAFEELSKLCEKAN
jgi:hypothetical protein